MTAVDELKEKIARKLEANPRLKTAMLADALGIAEADVMRAMPLGTNTELDATRSEEVIRGLEALGTLYVVVRNNVSVMEVKGRFGGFSQSGPFFNVAGENLHMHLKLGHVGAVFAVQSPAPEPGKQGMTSFQFFDKGGASALKAFILPDLVEKDGETFETRLNQWNELRQMFAI